MSTVTVLDVQWLEFGLYFDVFGRLKIYTFHEWIKIDADSPNKAKLFVVFNFDTDLLFWVSSQVNVEQFLGLMLGGCKTAWSGKIIL